MVALPGGDLPLRVGGHRHAAQVVAVQVDDLTNTGNDGVWRT
jgi:hypothetical protein